MPRRRPIKREELSSRKLSLSKSPVDTPTPAKRNKVLNDSSGNRSNRYSASVANKLLNSQSINKSCTTQSSPEDLLDIKDLYKVKWKVYRVSPLYNFNSNRLKIYGQKLREHLTVVNSMVQNVVYNCSFELMKLALEETYTVIKVKSEGNGSKYVGYFLKFDSSSDCERDYGNNVHFPAVLVQGQGKIVKQVHDIFCKLFDCDIHPIRFSLTALSSFLYLFSYMYVQNVPDLLTDVVTLSYRIPGCPSSDKIVIALHLAAVSTTFAVFRAEYCESFTNVELISGFYDCLLIHILRVFQVDLSPAELFKIQFPDFSVSSDGWVRFISEESADKAILVVKDFVKLENVLEM